MSGRAIKKGIGCRFVLMTVMGGGCGVAASACGVPAQALLYSTEVKLSGRTSLELEVRVPAATEILVTATTLQIDFRLEGTKDAAGITSAADDPVRRLGARRMILTTGALPSVGLRLSGKEQAEAHGIIRVEIAPLAATGDSTCIAAYRRMATGDESYARAQGALVVRVNTGIDASAEYRAAAKSYRDAVGVLLGVGADPLLAQAYLSLAAVSYQSLQEWQDAKQAATQARLAFTALNDVYGAARATAIGAAADMELALGSQPRVPSQPAATPANPLASVRRAFLDLARLHERRGESFDEALALNNAGLANYYSGDYNQAIADYRLALPIYRSLNEKPREAQALQNIALTEYELGRFVLAKRDFVRAIDLTEPEPASLLRGEMLNNQGLVEYAAGELDAALEHHGEALTILTQVQSQREQARSLHGIGSVYYAAGDRAQALDYLSRAIEMRDAHRDPRGRTASLRAKAAVLSDLHRLPEAIALRREALELAVSPPMRVRIETQLARDLYATGQVEAAWKFIDQAMGESGGWRSARALALLTRAELKYEAGTVSDAETDVSRALELLRNTEAPTDQLAALLLAAQIAQATKDLRRAGLLVDQAIQRAGQTRLQTLNPELRAGVWQSLKPLFDLKMQLQVQAGDSSTRAPARTVLALQTLATAEMSRARSLSDYQRSHGSVIGQGDSPNRESLRDLYHEIADRRYELEIRLDRSGDADPHSRAIQADIATLRRKIDALHRLEPADEPSEPSPAGVRAALKSISARIPADVAVIEYWLGTRVACAWIVTNDSLQMIPLASSERIDQAARAAHASLKNYETVSRERRGEFLSELSDLLVRPLQSAALGHHTLIFVPDGALHYVAFATLGVRVEGGLRPLIADHTILTVPSIASLGWKPASHRSPKRVLVVSDPVYSDDDSRLANSHPNRPASATAPVAQVEKPHFRSVTSQGGFERLLSTALEAESVTAHFDPTLVDSLSGLGASRQALLGLDLSQYRIIHFATHGVTDSEAPQLSAVVLSLRDSHGAETPGEVFAGEFLLREMPAQLVVLSACDTALGRETAGEGLLGLRYAVHAAGAKSVIASLWKVPDRSAAELMAAFYAHYASMQARPGEALSLALRESWQRLDDPALWGAFEISSIGDDILSAIHTD